ncbi:MAG: protein kinase [bacterium]|nr:protein kinase [bacterium]
MGTVYRARDPVLDRVVALKTIYTGTPLEGEAKMRFLREARSAARLQHPNIITVYELGEVEDAPYIAMEYLEGVSLAEIIERQLLESLDLGVGIIEQVCRGLAYAHSRGVVHRDIKPGNIVVLSDGTAKILDFGIAWLEGGTVATRTGMLLGTPSYMAPEQFSGQPVDHRVDLWAVGVIMYELLAGHRPFEGDNVPALIYKIVHTDCEALEPEALGIPASLVRVIHQALEKDPGQRYRDGETMAMAVRRAWLNPQESQEADASIGGEATTPMPAPAAAMAVAERQEAERTAARAMAARDAAAERPDGASRLLDRADTFHEEANFGEPLELNVIACAADESVLAVGGTDGSIRLWDLRTRMKTMTLRSRVHLRTGHAALVTCLAYSRTGDKMATGHLDGSIYLWDPGSGLEQEVKLGHEAAVTGLAFSPDGKTLVSGAKDSTLKCWDMDALMSGEARRMMRRQPADITCLGVLPDGEHVVTGHANRSLRIHELATGKLTGTVHGHGGAPNAIAISPDGKLAATGGWDRVVRIVDLEKRAVVREFEGHSRSVCAVVFFPNGRQLASAAMESSVAIWDLTQDEQILTLWGGSNESFASVTLLDGGGRLACGLTDGRIRIWRLY